MVSNNVFKKSTSSVSHITTIYDVGDQIALFAILDGDHEVTLFDINSTNNINAIRIVFPISSHLVYRHIEFYNENVLSVLLRSTQNTNKTSTYFLQLPIIKFRELAIKYKNGDQMRAVNAFDLIDESTIKSIEGIDGHIIAVSGPRKVSSILSETKKSIKIFEMEIEEDDDETNETSSQNVSMEN